MEHSLLCLKPDDKRKKEKEKNCQKIKIFPPFRIHFILKKNSLRSSNNFHHLTNQHLNNPHTLLMSNLDVTQNIKKSVKYDENVSQAYAELWN